MVNRRDARVPLLALAHQRLTLYGGEEWADMALRVMLEFERRA